MFLQIQKKDWFCRNYATFAFVLPRWDSISTNISWQFGNTILAGENYSGCNTAHSSRIFELATHNVKVKRLIYHKDVAGEGNIVYNIFVSSNKANQYCYLWLQMFNLPNAAIENFLEFWNCQIISKEDLSKTTLTITMQKLFGNSILSVIYNILSNFSLKLQLWS